MSFVVRFFSFTKRENSTKVPSEATILSGWRADCILLDDTSFMTPTFKIDRSDSANIINFNYCYVPHFNRYYFITDLRQYHNFWYVSCSCDVLATYKTAIGSGSHYVLRAASEYDGYIVDSIYPAKANQHEIKYTATNPLSWGTSASHSYVLGIIGYAPTSGKQVGSLTYYHMNETALNAFITFLMQDVEVWSDIATAEYDPAVQEALLNPMQYIVSCKAYPVAPPSTLAVNKIYFGYYEYGISTGTINVLSVSDIVTESTTFSSIPFHPEYATRGRYLNGAPYCDYILRCGPWGDIPLDPAVLLDRSGEGLTVNIRYDLMQGIGRLSVYPTSYPNMILYNGAATVGVDINLSQVLRNPLDYSMAAMHATTGFISNALSLGMGKLSGFGGALDSLYTGIDSATRLKFPSVQTRGTNGSFLSFVDSDYAFYLIFKYYDIVEENNAELGRPLCKLKQINTLSGFIMCQGADCQITGTQEEAIKVNQYMNTGFFYE